MSKVVPRSMNRKKLSWLLEQPVEVKLEILKQHMELSRLLINELLEDEVITLAGARYSHKKPQDGRYSRWGYNPGSVKIGDEKVRIDVPRVYDNEMGQCVSLEIYEQLKVLQGVNDALMKRVLHGISTNDYSKVLTHLLDSFGLSRSSVSKQFCEASEAVLESFHKRDLSQLDLVAIFLDGKHLAKEQIIIVLGITMQGDKIPLGFVQSSTEKATPVSELLASLIDRGLNYQQGLLCIIDGSKALRKAVVDTFGDYVIIQRCQWHKRENVVSYLSDTHKKPMRRKLTDAYRAETYDEAKVRLMAIKEELKLINLSAVKSLEEGLEETLTLLRLDLHKHFQRSFSTTNCIESLNSHLGKYIGRVKNWKNSSQRHRWIAAGLLEIEPRMVKIFGCKHLMIMRRAIQNDIGLNQNHNVA